MPGQRELMQVKSPANYLNSLKPASPDNNLSVLTFTLKINFFFQYMFTRIILPAITLFAQLRKEIDTDKNKAPFLPKTFIFSCLKRIVKWLLGKTVSIIIRTNADHRQL